MSKYVSKLVNKYNFIVWLIYSWFFSVEYQNEIQRCP